MPDNGIIIKLVNNVEGYLSDLEKVDSLNFKEFCSDIIKQRFIERTIHIVIESVLDVSHHIISQQKLREPDSYADSFNVLFENKIIKEKTLKSCKLMAQFRNRLVHYYEKNDPEIVYGIFKKNIYEVNEFIKDVKAFVK